ncbi:hypothetical protein L210DRAFT_938560 [Boletus edulis BED1]|uniref:Uncharacterized protein n=1 Tax=Boletus edulis BED1 TaxID=1328754 RepID=A0AAD4BXL8_BOLED|nr:hypothetical protein L210DRAFT_938560 [Boletus edulis BED1]
MSTRYCDTSDNTTDDTAVNAAALYRDETADIPLGPSGADNFPTGMNSEEEDAAVARSEDTGCVSKDEAEDLLAGTSEEERSKTGMKNDAF